MGRLRYLLAATAWVLALGASAQSDPALTHYWMVEPEYNPAAAGSTDYIRIVGAYSAQLTGYDDAPTTMYAGVDMPMFFAKPSHGLGVLFMNDEVGLFSNKRLSLQYSYRFKLFGGKLGIGVQGDMVTSSFDGTEVDVEESDDPAIPTSEVDGNRLDVGVGIYYTHRNWYAGISALHLTAPTINLGDSYETEVERTYYLTGGYNIRLRNPFLTIRPSVFAIYDGTDYKAVVTARVVYERDEKYLFGGVSYSPEHSVAAVLGGKFHGVVLSYSYEAYTSGIGMEHGTHEVVLSYEWKIETKKGKNVHRAVRLL